jgi:hypothetical protein
MSEPTPPNTPKTEAEIDQKPTIVQNIQTNLQARDQFNQQHQQWETNKKNAESEKSTIPEEPVASEAAQNGQRLVDARDESRNEMRTIFSESDKEKQNLRFNEIIKKIRENPNEQTRVMQIAGTLDSIKSLIYSQLWEHTSVALDVAPESLNFSTLLTDFNPLTYSDNHENREILGSDACQNVLKHLSSETSPAAPSKKEEFQFYAEEGKGTKAFDILYGNNSTQNPTPEQIITAFAFGEKITPYDILSATEKLRDRIRQDMANPSYENTLSSGSVAISAENMPLLLSQLISQKPEVSGDLKGILVGCCHSLAKNRPDLSQSNSYSDRDHDNKVKSYMRITHKIAQSLVNLYSPETNIYDEVLKKIPQNSFESELHELVRRYNLDNYMDSQSPFRQHFNKYLTVKSAAEAVAQKQAELKQADELIETKKSQEQIVKKYSENQDIRTALYPLYQSNQETLSAELDSSQQILDSLKAAHPELGPEIDFAKSVAAEFAKLQRENPLTTQTDVVFDRHKKGFLSNKFIVAHQITFPLDQARYNQTLEQVQKQISTSPTSENYARLEALALISKRSQVKRSISLEE